MNGRMIGVIGGTGRVGRECLRYLHENTPKQSLSHKATTRTV